MGAMTSPGAATRELLLRAIAVGLTFHLARRSCRGSLQVGEEESIMSSHYTEQQSQKVDGRGSTLLFGGH